MWKHTLSQFVLLALFTFGGTYISRAVTYGNDLAVFWLPNAIAVLFCYNHTLCRNWLAFGIDLIIFYSMFFAVRYSFDNVPLVLLVLFGIINTIEVCSVTLILHVVNIKLFCSEKEVTITWMTTL
jgi:integral membrane sensor domain MASE1